MLYYHRFPETIFTAARYCAEECARQRSGEVSVANMLDAWKYLAEGNVEITVSTVIMLGMLVEPNVNANGFRKSAVIIMGGAQQPIKWDLVPGAINNLAEATRNGDVTPLEFYIEFQKIHPFLDGNGRVGSLLWNYLSGNIFCPVTPPKFMG